MKREDIFIIIFLMMLIFGLYYLYQNRDSFECFAENAVNTGSDVIYEFEPEGSVYSKTKVFRFNVFSSRKSLEYFGMNISKENGEVLFFENRTAPEGGSIVSTLIVNESENFTVNRFFKKRCYPEVRLS
jgi:hypothetical protein